MTRVVDFEKAAVVTMFQKDTLLHAFDVVVYGVEVGDLMKVGNPIIHGLALRFPDFQSSPFHIKPMQRPRIWARRPRPPRPNLGASDDD